MYFVIWFLLKLMALWANVLQECAKNLYIAANSLLSHSHTYANSEADLSLYLYLSFAGHMSTVFLRL